MHSSGTAVGTAHPDYLALDEQVKDEAIEALRHLTPERVEGLVQVFYDTLMQSPEAMAFLDHSVVQQRLSRSLYNWMLELIAPETDVVSEAFIARQVKIGEVHARIKIPMHLVMSGVSILKSEIGVLMQDKPGGFAAYRLIDNRFDMAMRYMSQSYVKGTLTRARLDEAYRLFSLDQDITLERERQRGSLLEWSQSTLFRVLNGEAVDGTGRINNSPFGLWLRHRAGFLFEASSHLENLNTVVEQIDFQLLPQLGPDIVEDRSAALKALQAAVEEATYLLNEMFQVLGDMEGGRDPLTRALNRRFLPSILSREIGLANSEKSPLSVMLIDVDHFKGINDTYGHQSGDEALRQVASAIMENVRPSDFVFRYGGEEFLVILVETNAAQAFVVAERVRQAVQDKPCSMGSQAGVSVSVSVGVAEHCGHPDENFLIRSADSALYEAKRTGRNRVVTAKGK
jgi:diguanylate cyclase